MIEVSVCPACGNNSFIPHLQCIDHTVSHETFSLIRCTDCSLVITSPQPEPAQLGKYYESEDYISHSGKTKGGISSIYRLARSFNLRWKHKLISRFSQKGKILDFGCGTGEFLKYQKDAGWLISGVEPSDRARSKAQEITSVGISANLESISEHNFDVITLWHVLEHLPDPAQKVHQLLTLLAENGILIIALPNHNSPDASRYSSNWAAYDVPRHLWHFSRNSMEQFIVKTGSKIVSTIPMKLDAYYVSILSERYRNDNKPGMKQLVNGILAGYSSNQKASADNNYSSLVYIVKRP